MKNLKYIKLFEAFESVKLTKTLGYIDNKSRETFINYLKNLCSKTGFPISKLDDDMFQYLPYNKALKVNFEASSEPCKATSKGQYGMSGVEGEKCEGGKIKRMWGQRQRVVDCPNCKGTGLEPQKSEVHLIKFWFSKDGKYVSTTAVDGTTVESKSTSKLSPGEEIISGQRGCIDKIRSIPHLTNVILKTGSRGRGVPAVFYVQRNDYFCIQNEHNGGEPSDRIWNRYGRYSWNVSGGDFYSITVLNPPVEDENPEGETEIDPTTYNYVVNWGWRGTLQLDKYSNVEESIKDAHFALVMNLDKIRGDFKTVSDIKSEREELKSGSRLTVSDEDVRRENIQRYLTKIAEKGDIVSDITNVKSVVSRILNPNAALFRIVYKSSFENNFSRIINRYLEIMRTSEESKNYHIDGLKNYLKDLYNSSSEDSTDIRNILQYVRKELQSHPEKEKYTLLLDKLEEINKFIYQKLMSLPFDCIEDLEIIKSKIVTIRNLFISNTYQLDNLRYFIDAVANGRTDRAYSYLVDDWRLSVGNLDETMNGLETVKKILSRL